MVELLKAWFVTATIGVLFVLIFAVHGLGRDLASLSATHAEEERALHYRIWCLENPDNKPTNCPGL